MTDCVLYLYQRSFGRSFGKGQPGKRPERAPVGGRGQRGPGRGAFEKQDVFYTAHGRCWCDPQVIWRGDKAEPKQGGLDTLPPTFFERNIVVRQGDGDGLTGPDPGGVMRRDRSSPLIFSIIISHNKKSSGNPEDFLLFIDY